MQNTKSKKKKKGNKSEKGNCCEHGSIQRRRKQNITEEMWVKQQPNKYSTYE